MSDALAPPKPPGTPETGQRREGAGRIHGIEPARVQGAVFDLGGVFLEGTIENVVRFGERVGLHPDTWWELRRELFLQHDWWDRLERGEIGLDAFATELRRRLAAHGVRLTQAEARNFMGTPGDDDRMPLRQEIVDAAHAIHCVMPTALLTNNVREWREGWRRRLAVGALFDHVIDSSEVGMRKPEERIYAHTERVMGIAGPGLFFVDDLGMNLKPARARGWQTLKYHRTAEVLEVLHALASGRPARR